MIHKEFSSPAPAKVLSRTAPFPVSQAIGIIWSSTHRMPTDPPHACRCLFRGLCAEHTTSARAAQRWSMDSVAAAVPRDTAICGHPGCWRQRKGKASSPYGRWGFSGPGALTGPGRGSPGLAQKPGSSSCPSETLPSAPHPQDGRRRDVRQPISSLAKQRLYPLLPWQPAFSSGCLTLCTWYRERQAGRVWGNWERDGSRPQAAGPYDWWAWRGGDPG